MPLFTLKSWLRLTLALAFSAITAVVWAQPDTRISGVVRDLNTHREISNVNVFIKGLAKGVVTDFAGRYELRMAAGNRKTIVVFRHVAYEPREIALDSVAAMRYVYLQPRVINLGTMTIERESANRPEIAKDLPQAVSMIEAKNFEIRGYVDAGDLLRTDHSIQVEEELSGKKTVAIRGGNADEVVVLYNGVKMNNTFDNVFDLALIDLEDVERFEVIKGSNTALYGPEAFSGVINIVPKAQHDYSVRFQQRVGTYRSGNWGLHLDPSSLFQNKSRFNASYSFKRGGTKRNFVDAANDESGLTNTSLHHTGNLVYHFSETDDGQPRNKLSVMYIHSALEYENRRDDEQLNNLNQLLSLRYDGDWGKIRDVDVSLGLRQLDEEQFLNATSTGVLNRDINDRALQFNAEKRFRTPVVDLLLAYQFQHAELDFKDVRTGFNEIALGPESGLLQRQHHGLVAIAKWHNEKPAEVFQTVDFDASLRHDLVRDEQDLLLRPPTPAAPLTQQLQRNDWRETMFKFSLNMAGLRDNLSYNAFLKFGNNTKFPTLFQQISVPDASAEVRNRPNLNPEKNRSIELGVTFTREINVHPSIYGWGLSGTFFQNHYDNKFRIFATYGVPVAFYDNVADARISGFEAKPSLYLFRKKVTLEAGLSRYYISERAAFPFKSDLKRTLSFNLDHAGYSFQALWFKEGEQAGWLRRSGTDLTRITPSDFGEVVLPGYTNLDVHVSKNFEWGQLKLFLNASGRNLLNGEKVVLQGIALRDRRYYLTVGAQY